MEKAIVAAKEAQAEYPSSTSIIKTVQIDVEDDESITRAFEHVETEYGRLDVLINNHGVAGPRGYIEDLDYEEWDHCIRVNLGGMFYTIKNAVPHMKKQRSGCIINLSTSSARTMLPKRAAYVAGKVAVLGLTKNCARELGPWNIRCNTVLPGFMNNARGRGVLAKVAADKGIPAAQLEQEALQYVSMRTWIEMDEIADLCAFLASDQAKHISGQEIAVDGNAEWEE